MKIKRFDKVEHDIFSLLLGYYQGDEWADRAEILMDEGILEKYPRSEWPKKGWKYTPYGEKYRAEFIRIVREKHGHEWEKNEYDNDVDFFAYSMGYHNGPRCKNCGYEFCHHCDSEFELIENHPCPSKKG